jgi:6,7-dimethyl-8-ribityllumazine synthase
MKLDPATAVASPLDAGPLRLPDGRARVAIVAARFNAHIVDRLVDGARAELARHGLAERDVQVLRVAGAWELPLAAQAEARRGAAAVIALGCVVRGETGHYEVIVNESARGLMDVMLATGVPVANGVLAVESEEQALARAGGAHGNKGQEAAEAALDLALALRRIPPALPATF